MDHKISVALLAWIGKTPEEIALSFIFDEAYRLADNGVNVHVVNSKVEGDSFSYGMHFHGFQRKSAAQVIKSLVKSFPAYPLISLLRNPLAIYYENLYTANVSDVIAKNKINLIHAHFAYPEGLVGLLAKKRTGKPLVVTCHGYDINIVPEVSYGIRLSKKHDALVRMVLENTDAIICVSTKLRDEVLKLGANVKKTFVVFNSVDLDLFRPPKKYELAEIKGIRKLLEVSEDEFLILNARHLKPIYGVEYLIMAAKLVTEQVKNVKFIIAGDGELKEKLDMMIHSLGIEKNVKLIGTLPRALMPKLMRASSLYVNTSLSDGMSPSMLQACASGLPIVSFDVGGASDIIDDGVNGFLVPLKDYKTLASKIIFMLKNSDMIKRFSVNGRKKAEEYFDINKRIRKMINIYDKLSR
jgi:glycosyltransferase involved in cell wall biosynthesis